jgi:putative membrane protein
MVASAPALAAAAAYLTAVSRVRRWPWWRTAAFLAGLAVLAVAQLPQIDGRATERLPIHMLQHLLVTMVAAPALVAGAPLMLALRAFRGSWRAAVCGRTLRTLTRPLVAWSLFAVVLAGSHVPAFYDLALREPGVHAVEHALYLWSAILFWTPLLAPLPRRVGGVGAVAYLLLAMAPMSLVGAWLLSAGTVVYPHYATLGATALADQRAGAAAMWLGGTIVLVVAVVACGWSALAREERRALAREAAFAGGRR